MIVDSGDQLITAVLPPEKESGRSVEVASRSMVFIGLGLMLVITNALLWSGTYIHWITPSLGVCCAVGIPAFLIYGSGIVPANSISEQIGLSVILSALFLIVIGLAINWLLPFFGIRDPLGETSVVLSVDVAIAALGIWSWKHHPVRYRVQFTKFTRHDRFILCLSGAIPTLSVLGAVRLNNGTGGSVTLLMLVLAALLLGLLLAWNERLSEGVVTAAIYLLSVALLFMTSLRGWYTTGHDVQREYRVFELTKVHGEWSMSLFKDAYNACMSITVLPTMLWQWTRVDDPYIYKVFFQLFFALCPMLVYKLARRIAMAPVAILAVIYFVSFVTFFEDMPMLNRQEVAFLFLTGSLLIVFNDTQPIKRRRYWFCIFSLGMILSHYSTTYVAIGVFVLAWALGVIVHPLLSHVERTAPSTVASIRPRIDQRKDRRVLTITTVGVVVVASFIWTGLLTHTQGGLTSTVSVAIQDLRGGNGDPRSSDTSYSLFGGVSQTDSQLLASYERTTYLETAGARERGLYYSASELAKYPVRISPDASLPLTSIGRFLANLGLNVPSFNYSLRQDSAKVLQLLIILGIGSLLFAKRGYDRLRRLDIVPTPEYMLIAIASILVVALQVFLPAISADYGLLRAFQQALLVLDVVIVAGSLALLPRVLGAWRLAIAGSLAILFFISSTGVITQTLGGYGPQLHLNNAGIYYDNYYLHPQEVTGIAWLDRTASVHGNVQAEVETDRYTFSRLQTLTSLHVVGGIFPTLIRKDAYVYLGYANVRNARSSISLNGTLITYGVPLGLLNNNSDLIYNNGGCRVYG